MFNILYNKIKRRIDYYLMFYSKREKYISRGDDFPDKTFYVIGIDYDTQGLLAIVKNILIHIEYALDKGYIPIVDMQNFVSQFGSNGEKNAWEIFFKQPYEIGLEDIQNARSIILSRNIATWLGHSIFLSVLDDCNKRRFEKLKSLYKQYVIPSEGMLTHMKNEYKEIIDGKSNVLGVLCRGTDYTQKRPSGHSIQPSFEQIKGKVDEFRKRLQIDYIFVATEDTAYLNRFKEEYDEMLLYVDQKRFGDLKVDYISEIGMDNSSLIQMNMDYYASLFILSKCDYFISGKTAGALGVAFMTEGFKESYFFELGHYK